MQLAPLHGHGWTRNKDGNLDILYWDTEENRFKVKNRVDLSIKGCSCRSGCDTKRCGCRRNGEACGPGCRCVNYTEGVAEMKASHYDTLQDDISAIMQNVYGPQESEFIDGSESSEDSDSSSSSSVELEGPNPTAISTYDKSDFNIKQLTCKHAL